MNVPINFVLPNLNVFGDVDKINVDECQAVFSRARETMILQSYLVLKNYRPGLINYSKELSIGSINVVLNLDVRLLRSMHNTFIVGVRTDKPKIRLAHCEIVQNPCKEDSRRFFIPLWPQPGLIPRPWNKNKIKVIGYTGVITPGLTKILEELKKFVQPFGLIVQTLDPTTCNDLSGIDILIAIRDFSGNPEYHKPPSKLINAWHANIPVIATPESAYRAIGERNKDYLEVKDQLSLNDAVYKLARNGKVYDLLRRNGAIKAKKYTREKIAERWLYVIDKNIFPIYLDNIRRNNLHRETRFLLNKFLDRISSIFLNSYSKKLFGYLLSFDGQKRILSMLQERIKRIKKRGRINLHTPIGFLKICFRNAEKIGACQIKAIAITSTNSPWKGLNCCLTVPLFHSRYLAVFREPKIDNTQISDDTINALIKKLLTDIPSKVRRVHWQDTLETNHMKSVWLHISPEEEEFVKHVMGDLRLPVTSAHGDLHYKNLLEDMSGNIWITDWEGFRANGSCFEDACGLIMSYELYKLHKNGRNEDYNYGIASYNALNSGAYKIVSANTALTEVQAALLGALSRVHIGFIESRNYDLGIRTFKEILKRVREYDNLLTQ